MTLHERNIPRALEVQTVVLPPRRALSGKFVPEIRNIFQRLSCYA